jgi:nucleoside-diphosphate-sugar epimerase
MKILVLGGTRYVGKLLVLKLLLEGHNIVVLNRGNNKVDFGANVDRIYCNRSERNQMERILVNKHFDIIYDNICYKKTDAKITCDIFNIKKPDKYILVSSSYVYQPQPKALNENDFNESSYDLTLDSSINTTYKIGKKEAEAYFAKNANFDVVSVRFPIIMGWNDVTMRFSSCVSIVMNHKPFYIPDIEGAMNFIRSEDAASFLCWIKDINYSGAINGASLKSLTSTELIQMYSLILGEKINIHKNNNNINQNSNFPYYISDSMILDTSKANKLGYEFQKFDNWFISEVEITKKILNKKN